MKKFFLLCSLCFASLAFAQQSTSQGIYVNGTGTIRVVPDQAVIKVRSEYQGESANQVKEKVDADISEVIKFLKKEGIPSKNIQTEYVHLGKSYHQQVDKYQYRAYQSLSVLLEDVTNYEEIMNGLMTAGINAIESVIFQSSTEEELRAKARKKAIENAKMKAKEYAEALGQSVGKAFYVSENQNNYPQPVMFKSMDSAGGSSGKQTIAIGELEVSVAVQVGFLLK